MPTNYIVQPSDTLCNIAYKHGLADCTTLRAEPGNAAIVARNGFQAAPAGDDEPIQLIPGETVVVPDKTEKKADGSTEQKHSFVVRGDLATIRFVHGSPNLPYASDLTLNNLNISNYITNRGGAADGSRPFPADTVRRFNNDGHTDPDTFKVEVFHKKGAGDINVDIEVLRPVYNPAGVLQPNFKRFPAAIRGDRLMTSPASKQGSTQCFRTCYLRLVVDAADKAAAGTQTLLASDMHDAGDSKVEILDQMVKASFEIPSCTAGVKCKTTVKVPIGNDRKRLRLAIHVLRKTPGGALIVPLAGAERRVWTWFRRVYAQAGIGPKLARAVRGVDPPENLVSISNDSGLTAAGDGQLKFRINAAGKASQVIGPITPGAGDTPLTTANALAALISAPYTAKVSENPARFNDPAGQKSADIVITETSGVRVTIDQVGSGDSRQTLKVGRANPLNLESWAVPAGNNNWNAGSLEQRTVLKNHDTGDDRVDVFVVQSLSGGSGGEAMMSNHRVDPARPSISQVKFSAFIIASMMDGTDNDPFAMPHEVGHVAGEVVHTSNAENEQLMNEGYLGSPNAVGLRKRIRDGAARYTSPVGNFNLVDRIRLEGAPLLESW
ncbi:MAG: hypothetical protein R2747_02015 [Pyrinomonadaceae bacterium]